MDLSDLKRVINRIKVEENYKSIDPICERIDFEVSDLRNIMGGKVKDYSDLEKLLEKKFKKYYFKSYDDHFTNDLKRSIPKNVDIENISPNITSEPQNNYLSSTDILILEIHQMLTYLKEKTELETSLFSMSSKKQYSEPKKENT